VVGRGTAEVTTVIIILLSGEEVTFGALEELRVKIDDSLVCPSFCIFDLGHFVKLYGIGNLCITNEH